MKDCEVYKLIFENTVNAVFLIDPSGKIHEANSAAEEMLGMNKKEIFSLNWDKIIDLSDPNTILFQNETEKIGKAISELKLIRKDGTKLPVEASCDVLNLQSGETRICIFARDIVETKINQILMKEASEFNRMIIKTAPVGIATYNSLGQCISVNNNFAETIGSSKEELLKQNFTELVSWKKYGLYALARFALDEGTEVHKEIFVVTTFGKSLWLNLTFKSFNSGSEPHLLMIIQDISERKKAEELLKKSEEKFRTSVENMLDPFAIFEASRNSKNEIIDFSTRYINPAGVVLAEKISASTPLRHLLEIFTLQDYPVMFSEFCEVVETGKSISRETVLYDSPDGSGIKCALDFSIVKLGDGLAVSCRDITPNKVILETLTKINKNKDKLFSVIAHDLKAPFNSFLGMSEVLANGSGELSPEDAKIFFKSSAQTVKNTFKLLEDLLEWANNQSGSTVFNPVVFSLSDMVEQAIMLYDNIAKEKGISLIFNNAMDYDVLGDRNMIDTVCRNLISNAIKFTNRRGKVEINVVPNSSHCKVLVKDTGVGISENVITRILKLGERVTTTGTNNEKGTGLGLPLCKDFVERNNGELKVESVPGKGSTFTFTIPLAPVSNN